MERILGFTFLPFIQRPHCIGSHQFAYLRKRGARDAVALLTCSWIVALNSRSKIGVYCADVAGAFDRVLSTRLLHTLHCKGVHPMILLLLQSWLRKRSAQVVVSGCRSFNIDLHNQVYQGTVWGPNLWNAFFGDVQKVVRDAGVSPLAFADDLNCHVISEKDVHNATVMGKLIDCQQQVHSWGRANGVSF